MPHFDDFIIIFGKDKATREGVKTTTNAVEQDNDKEDEFVNANDKYHEEPQEEREEENQEYIVVSTCNTIVSASRRTHASKKKAKSFNGTSDLVEQLAGF